MQHINARTCDQNDQELSSYFYKTIFAMFVLTPCQ